MLLDLWNEVGGYAAPPEACLVNYYAGEAKMGLHQDKDEEDFAAPVLSVSLGDTGIFRVGGTSRKDPTETYRAQVRRCGGAGRRGPARLITASTASSAGTSDLLAEGGRFNLTLRRVTKPE